jgi:hypothetical protein
MLGPEKSEMANPRRPDISGVDVDALRRRRGEPGA